MSNTAFQIRDKMHNEGFVVAASEFLTRWAFYTQKTQETVARFWGIKYVDIPAKS